MLLFSSFVNRPLIDSTLMMENKADKQSRSNSNKSFFKLFFKKNLEVDWIWILFSICSFKKKKSRTLSVSVSVSVSERILDQFKIKGVTVEIFMRVSPPSFELSLLLSLFPSFCDEDLIFSADSIQLQSSVYSTVSPNDPTTSMDWNMELLPVLKHNC